MKQAWEEVIRCHCGRCESCSELFFHTPFSLFLPPLQVSWANLDSLKARGEGCSPMIGFAVV